MISLNTLNSAHGQAPTFPLAMRSKSRHRRAMGRDADLHRKLLKLNRQYIRAIIAAHKNAERDDERWQTPTEAARGCGLAAGTFNKILNEENPPTHSLSWRTLSQMRNKSGVPLPTELLRVMVPPPLYGNAQKSNEHGTTGSGQQRDITLNVGDREMSYAKDTLRSLVRHFTLTQVNIWIGEIAEENRDTPPGDEPAPPSVGHDKGSNLRPTRPKRRR